MTLVDFFERANRKNKIEKKKIDLTSAAGMTKQSRLDFQCNFFVLFPYFSSIKRLPSLHTHATMEGDKEE